MNYIKRTNKESVVGGATLNDFGYEKLDRGKGTLEERLELVNDLLRDNTYFQDMMTICMENYDCKKGYLHDDYEYVNRLLAISNYILFSPDVERGAKLEYRIYEHESLSNFNHINTASIEGICECGAEPVMTTAKKNYKLDKKITLDNIDIPELLHKYPYIQDYFDLLCYLDDNKDNRAKKKDVTDDILYIADMHNIRFKQPLADGKPTLNLEDITFDNAKVIKLFLKMEKKEYYDFNNDIDILLYDFDELVKRSRLTPQLKSIREKLRLGYTEKEIAEKIGVTQQRVNGAVRQIVDNVIKQYNKELL